MYQMRQSLLARVSPSFAPLRRNSRPVSFRGRFKYISRFREYTRSYHSWRLSDVPRVGRLQPTHVSNYLWWAGSSYARPSKVRRFLVARLKRISAETSTIEAAWVVRGSRIFLFKKGQNSRMGKGCGSFHSTRRQVSGRSLIARVSTSFSFVISNIDSYIRARWGFTASKAEQYSHPLLLDPNVEALNFELGCFEPILRQKFRRRRAT